MAEKLISLNGIKGHITGFISDIDQIIEDYAASHGDEAANAHADACEKYRDNIKDRFESVREMVGVISLKLAAIVQHEKDAKQFMDFAMIAKEIAEQKLADAKSLITPVAVAEDEEDGDEPEDPTLAELK
jgi:hypothetical protein